MCVYSVIVNRRLALQTSALNLEDLVDVHFASFPVHVSIVHTLLHLLIFIH